MRYARSPDKQLIEATRGLAGFCPGCESLLVAKCGTIISPHWAHHARPDCDTWSEPESAWHLGWKSHAPPERTEVVMGASREHRADVVLPDGRVLELQHSALSVDAIREREEFYTREAGGMVWLWDASRFWHSVIADGSLLELPRHRVLDVVSCAMYWDVPAHATHCPNQCVTTDVVVAACQRLTSAQATAASCAKALADRRASLERHTNRLARADAQRRDALRRIQRIEDSTLRAILGSRTLPQVRAHEAAERAEAKALCLVRQAESAARDAEQRVGAVRHSIDYYLRVAALQAAAGGGILQVSPQWGRFRVEQFIPRDQFASMIRGTP